MPNIRTRGKRQIRWYQHRTQGANSITELKNMLPRVELVTRNQQMNKMVQFDLAVWLGWDIKDYSRV